MFDSYYLLVAHALTTRSSAAMLEVQEKKGRETQDRYRKCFSRIHYWRHLFELKCQRQRNALPYLNYETNAIKIEFLGSLIWENKCSVVSDDSVTHAASSSHRNSPQLCAPLVAKHATCKRDLCRCVRGGPSPYGNDLGGWRQRTAPAPS